MELLVERDPNYLRMVPEGKSFVDSDLPKFLHTPWAVRRDLVGFLKEREEHDLLIRNDGVDSTEMELHLNKFESGNDNGLVSKVLSIFGKGTGKNSIELPGVWSGYRSTLIANPNGGFYRLKGVSLNPYNPEIKMRDDGHITILGGQKKSNVEYEAEMSERFNKSLESEGIEPMMRVRGMWKYPKMASRYRPSASIVEVKGDTRLDELSWVMGGLFFTKLSVNVNGNSVTFVSPTYSGIKFCGVSNELYRQIGFSVGNLKKIMDIHGQTWSSDDVESNAHAGNIVIYNDGSSLRTGLVDFDMSCDARDFSKSEIKSIQKMERESLLRSVRYGMVISPRKINGIHSSQEHTMITFFSDAFIEGFNSGYDSTSSKFTNKVDLSLLEESFDLLRSVRPFNFAPSPRTLCDLIGRYDSVKRSMNLFDISDQSYKHEKGLFSYKKDIKEKSNYLIGDYGLYNYGSILRKGCFY